MLMCHGGISVSSVGVLHSLPFYMQPKVNSHSQDEDGEDDDADDHSHQGAVVVAFAQRTCVGDKEEIENTTKARTLPGFTIQHRRI